MFLLSFLHVSACAGLSLSCTELAVVYADLQLMGYGLYRVMM